MIWYRPHRGSLADAMREARTYLNELQMKVSIANEWNVALGKRVLDPEDIVISEEHTDDNRVGWKNVHVICINRLGKKNYVKMYGCPQCIGYCAYEVEKDRAEEIKWISTKNSLPKAKKNGGLSEAVLVTVKKENGEKETSTGYYEESEKCWRDSFADYFLPDEEVTHWAYFPKPAK